MSELSLEDFLKSTGMTPAAETPTSSPNPKTVAFTQRHYPLFTLPVATVYLKGLLPTLGSEPTLTAALSVALVRPIGGGKRATLAKEVTSLLKEIKTTLYTATGKAEQLELVNAVIEAGYRPDPSKCLSKSFALSALTEYLADRSAHLLEQGFNSIEDYLEAAPESSGKAAKGLAQVVKVDDLDWDF